MLVLPLPDSLDVLTVLYTLVQQGSLQCSSHVLLLQFSSHVLLLQVTPVYSLSAVKSVSFGTSRHLGYGLLLSYLCELNQLLILSLSGCSLSCKDQLLLFLLGPSLLN